MYRPIIIEKMDIETEEWSRFFSGFARVNKASGREYFNAKTNITQNTYNFTTHYISKLEELKFNTNQYRIKYKNNIFDIVNVDDKEEKHINLTIVGECRTI